jgi:hypothetical protein
LTNSTINVDIKVTTKQIGTVKSRTLSVKIFVFLLRSHFARVDASMLTVGTLGEDAAKYCREEPLERAKSVNKP